MADELLRQLKAPNSLREQVVTLISHHMTKLPADKKLLRRWLGRLGEESMDQLLLLQESDMGSKGTGIPREMDQFPRIRQLLKEIREENSCLSLKDLAVNGHDLMALGITGKAIGRTLNFLLEQVLDEKLPNHRDSLLTAATEFFENE
jgi:tRNA nucleotidyltransferase (CCA-adding enzyme)